MQLQFIDTNSPEYLQACKIRYQLFFAEHNLPFSTVYYHRESIAIHAVIKTDDTNEVIAYGILTPGENKVYQIHQMVVEPSYQKQGLGKMIMQTLIDKAKTQQARSIILEARTTAVDFYRKFGFEVVSREYPSKKTGVLHVTMLKNGIGNS
ncbi:MAG: GNAT family N-acetyltransferase [Rivularia sp. (in: cyanobacteria)]